MYIRYFFFLECSSVATMRPGKPPVDFCVFGRLTSAYYKTMYVLRKYEKATLTFIGAEKIRTSTFRTQQPASICKRCPASTRHVSQGQKEPYCPLCDGWCQRRRFVRVNDNQVSQLCVRRKNRKLPLKGVTHDCQVLAHFGGTKNDKDILTVLHQVSPAISP